VFAPSETVGSEAKKIEMMVQRSDDLAIPFLDTHGLVDLFSILVRRYTRLSNSSQFKTLVSAGTLLSIDFLLTNVRRRFMFSSN
jgi:hypothetical protein